MGAGRIIGKVGKEVLRPFAHAANGVNHGINDLAAMVSEGPVRWGGKGLGHVAKKTMIKHTPNEKNLGNGYTGYQMSKFGNHATGWGTLAVVAPAFALGNGSIPGMKGVETRANKVGTSSYGGHPSVMDADGMGTATQAPSLGASGNLVFGLHNGRKG